MAYYVHFTGNSSRRAPVGPFKEELKDFRAWVSGIPPNKINQGLFLLGLLGELSRPDLEAFYNSYEGKMNKSTIKYCGALKESLERGEFGGEVETPPLNIGFIDDVVNGLLFKANPYFSVREAEKMLPHVRKITKLTITALETVDDYFKRDALECLRDSMNGLGQACAFSIMLRDYKPVFYIG